uniref:B double prime 1, subunit of RNA polymerase III transcription initiation factor IIIB n=1 Tax=Myotis myotis TaxID=51298 RepID=A0A7J7XX60_MYOMY|nr:B double prime 1, subunit of RNA polymerase III transcription initiation factor IIIB [Myotis myotis]
MEYVYFLVFIQRIKAIFLLTQIMSVTKLFMNVRSFLHLSIVYLFHH